MTNRIAIYPGSFDPPTNGHLDLITRASKIFDTLIVAVAQNDAKLCLFSESERIDMLTQITRHLPNIKVSAFHSLTAHFAAECSAIAIVRGLRVISDFEFELTMAITNQRLNPAVDTVCLLPSEPYIFLSSRLVKEIAGHGGDITPFVPKEVLRKLMDRINA